VPLSRPVRALVALVLLAGLAACEEHTVAVRFEPEVGDVYRFRAEIGTEVVRVLGGDETHEVDDAELEATQTVRAVADDEVLVRVSLQQGDAAPRTVDVRLDRASRLTAIDLIEGVPATALGLDLAMDLPADISSPPTGPLEPGDRWVIEREVSMGELPRPVTIRGRGRIDSLGVEDGHDVAVAVVELEVPVRSVVDAEGGQARLVGVQRTVSETAYDLADGAMRRDRTVTRGEVSVVAEPPPGIEATPVRGDIRYRIETRTARIGTTPAR
jgi:hypothetical protein